MSTFALRRSALLLASALAFAALTASAWAEEAAEPQVQQDDVPQSSITGAPGVRRADRVLNDGGVAGGTVCNDPDGSGQGVNQIIGQVSDIQTDFRAAESLQFPSPGNAIISWRGFYVDFVASAGCGPAVTSDLFNFSVLEDNGGAPGALILDLLVTPVSKTQVGTIPTSIGDLAEYEYTALLGSVPAGCVWLEITHTNTPTDCFWLWETAPASAPWADQRSQADDGFGYATGTVNDFDMALCIDGLAATACPPSYSCTPTVASGAPANDCCDAPLDVAGIVGTIMAPFDNTDANTDGPLHPENPCDSGSGDLQIHKDLWYRYTAPATGALIVSTCQTAALDTKIAAYDLDGLGGNTCDTLGAGLISCDEDCDAVTFTSTLVLPVETGGQYMIRLGSYSPTGNDAEAESGIGTISFTMLGTASNDACADALPVVVGDNVFTTVGATTDGLADPLCDQFGDPQVHNDVWFVFTAPCDGNYTFSTCNLADYDSKIAVYDGNCVDALGGLPPIACNDDADDCDLFTSELTVALTGASTYLVRIGGFSATDSGSGVLRIIGGTGCPADFNCDGNVNASDLAQLLSFWGACPVSPCPRDLNNDGIVNAADLAQLLGVWGPTPCGPQPGETDAFLATEVATTDPGDVAFTCNDDFNVDVCRLYVDGLAPTDQVISVAFSDISTDAPGGFFQILPGMGGADTAPSQIFVSIFPELVCDSFVTLDLLANPVGGGDATALDQDFDSTAFNTAGQVEGGWYINNPPGGQAVAGADGRVLIGQFAMTRGFSVSGEVTVYVNSGDVSFTESFECPLAPCLADQSLCDDGVVCTFDFCDPDDPRADANGCVHEADDSQCDDGLFCNGEEFCDPVLGCQPGTPPDCDDGIDCTIDACNEFVDTCSNAPGPGCDDGNTCTDDICLPGIGCIHLNNAAPCDDGDACTENDTCSGGSCSGSPVDCDDDNPCTADSCNPGIGCTYEVIPGCCPGDTNADLVVNVDDLVNVVLCWLNPDPAACGGPLVNADVDDGSSTGTPDGIVNVDDLVYVIVRWNQVCSRRR